MRIHKVLNGLAAAALGLAAVFPACPVVAGPVSVAHRGVLAGPALVLTRIEDLGIRAGASARVPVSVRNTGDAVAEGLTLAWSTTGPVGMRDGRDRCRYQDYLAEVLCFYDVRLLPGDVFTTNAAQSLTLDMSANAAGPAAYRTTVRVIDGRVDNSIGELDAHDVEAFAIGVPLTVADSVAIGRSLSGKVGETRTFRIGFSNNGPADRLRPLGSGFAAVGTIVLPIGLRVTRVDPQCAPLVNGKPDRSRVGVAHGRRYRCYLLYEQANSPEHLVLTVTIIGPAGAPGTARIDGGVQDPDPSNNNAPIALNVIGEPTPAAGVDLPITGSSAIAPAVAGVLLLLGGGLALALALAGRRRTIVG